MSLRYPGVESGVLSASVHAPQQSTKEINQFGSRIDIVCSVASLSIERRNPVPERNDSDRATQVVSDSREKVLPVAHLGIDDMKGPHPRCCMWRVIECIVFTTIFITISEGELDENFGREIDGDPIDGSQGRKIAGEQA